jgi:hypothetical protein
MVEQTQSIQKSVSDGPSMPLVGAIVMAAISALVVGFSFVVIKFWPQPASVSPAFGFAGGAWWGIIVGGLAGFILGFLTDDKHFK